MPHSVYMWLTLLRSCLFISRNGFSDCQRPEEKRTVPRYITKKAEVRFTSALIGENRNGQAGFRPFLLPTFEDFLHGCIQCSLHTFLHHLKNNRIHHSLLFLFALLLVFLLLTHFTFTTLLNVILGITTFDSTSFAAIIAFLRSMYSFRICLCLAYKIYSGV